MEAGVGNPDPTQPVMGILDLGATLGEGAGSKMLIVFCL